MNTGITVSPRADAPSEEPLVGVKIRSLTALRLGLFLTAAAGAAAIGAIYLSLPGEPRALALAAAVLLATAVVVEFTLNRLARSLRRGDERMRALWEDRQLELQDIAARDDLTQLQNRRFFYGRLQDELDHAQRLKKSLSVLMIDVDDLKGINDEFGHQVGDAVLRSFARILNHHARAEDVTARLGGDEFAVIMPDSDRRAADALAWRLWEELARTAVVETDHASIFLGVSVGTGGYPWGGNDLEEIIHWADTKLYANKLERKGFKQANNGKKDSRLVSAVVDVLSTALDIRDQMTHRHARRVARMAACIAREMKLSEDDVLEIEYAAALHDIGKIGVADGILRKAEALDDNEWRDMRRHAELGYRILNGIDFLQDAAEIVHSHHERYDGNGYPRGLAGEEIPLGARVFSVVDAFDAMTSRRPYRDAIPREAALMEVARNAGTQFDPHVVETFLQVVRRSPDGFRDDEEEFGSRIQEDGSSRKLGNGSVGQTGSPVDAFTAVDGS